MAAVAGALSWDGTGSKKYENGVSKGVLYLYDSTSTNWEGVAWNGLTAVTESPEGAENTDLYADNIKYASMRSAETFGGTIEAYTYPDEFAACDGSYVPAAGINVGQQPREKFRFCFRTEQGNDQKTDLGYKLHLIYNSTCSPSEKAYETVNDSPDAITLSWEFTTDSVSVTGHKPTFEITVDSTKFTGETLLGYLGKLEEILYGKTGVKPRMPDPDEVISWLTTGSYTPPA